MVTFGHHFKKGGQKKDHCKIPVGSEKYYTKICVLARAYSVARLTLIGGCADKRWFIARPMVCAIWWGHPKKGGVTHKV